MNIEDYKRCDYCEGRKKFAGKKCSWCNGLGFIKK